MNRNLMISPELLKMSPERYRAARMYGESTYNMIVLPTMYIAHNAFVELTTQVAKPKNKKYRVQMRKVYMRDANAEFDKIMENCIEKKRDDVTQNYLYRYNDLVDDKFHSKIREIRKIILEKMIREEEFNERDAALCSWLMTISGLLKYSCHVCVCITEELTEIFHKNVFDDFKKMYLLSEVDRLIDLFIDDIKCWFPDIKKYDVRQIKEVDSIIENIDLEIRRETILEKSQIDASTEFTEDQRKQNQEKAQETIELISGDIDAHREKYKDFITEK